MRAVLIVLIASAAFAASDAIGFSTRVAQITSDSGSSISSSWVPAAPTTTWSPTPNGKRS